MVRGYDATADGPGGDFANRAQKGGLSNNAYADALLITVHAAAQRLGITEGMLRTWLSRGIARGNVGRPPGLYHAARTRRLAARTS
jgi:hypothetical protein